MLATPADVRAHLQGYTTDEDRALLRALSVAQAQVATHCGWPAIGDAPPTLERASRTFYLSGPMRRRPDVLQLPVFPVASVTSVTQWSGSAYFDTVPAAQYELLQAQGRVRLLLSATRTWLRGDRRIRVVCVAGYTAETAPGDLVDAIARLASHVSTVGRGSRVESTSRAGSTVQFRPVKMPADVRELLARFRLPTALGMGEAAA